MTTYTPGKWRVVDELDIVAPCESDCFHGEEWAGKKHDIEIATTGTSIQRFYEVAKANARLIAASPELYEELFRALAVIRNPQAFETEQVANDIERVLATVRSEKVETSK